MFAATHASSRSLKLEQTLWIKSLLMVSHSASTSWPLWRDEGTHRPSSPQSPRWSRPTAPGPGLTAATLWTPRTARGIFAQPVLHLLCSMTGGPILLPHIPPIRVVGLQPQLHKVLHGLQLLLCLHPGP